MLVMAHGWLGDTHGIVDASLVALGGCLLLLLGWARPSAVSVLMVAIAWVVFWLAFDKLVDVGALPKLTESPPVRDVPSNSILALAAPLAMLPTLIGVSLRRRAASSS